MQQIKKNQKKKRKPKGTLVFATGTYIANFGFNSGMLLLTELLINPRVPISISELYPLFLEERDRPPNVLNCLYCQLGLHLHIKQ